MYLFQHFVLLMKIVLAYVIPDSPNNLRVQLQRERQTQREAQFQQDQRRPGTRRRSSLVVLDSQIRFVLISQLQLLAVNQLDAFKST